MFANLISQKANWKVNEEKKYCHPFIFYVYANIRTSTFSVNLCPDSTFVRHIAQYIEQKWY